MSQHIKMPQEANSLALVNANAESQYQVNFESALSNGRYIQIEINQLPHKPVASLYIQGAST